MIQKIKALISGRVMYLLGGLVFSVVAALLTAVAVYKGQANTLASELLKVKLNSAIVAANEQSCSEQVVRLNADIERQAVDVAELQKRRADAAASAAAMVADYDQRIDKIKHDS